MEASLSTPLKKAVMAHLLPIKKLTGNRLQLLSTEHTINLHRKSNTADTRPTLSKEAALIPLQLLTSTTNNLVAMASKHQVMTNNAITLPIHQTSKVRMELQRHNTKATVILPRVLLSSDPMANPWKASAVWAKHS